MKLLKKEKIYPYMGIGEGQFYAILKKDDCLFDKNNEYILR